MRSPAITAVTALLLVACAAGQGVEYEAADIAVAAATGPTDTRDGGELAIIQAGRVSETDAGTGSGGTGGGNGVDAAPDAGAPRALVMVCLGKKTRSTCDACCRAAFPKGPAQCVTVWWQSLSACACDATSACRAVCGSTVCKGGLAAPGSACESCLNATDSCRDRANFAAPDCDLFTRCENDSGCATM